MNLRAHLCKTIILWILEAWKRLDSAMVATSFRSCGVCLADDGSLDKRFTVSKKANDAILVSRD